MIISSPLVFFRGVNLLMILFSLTVTLIYNTMFLFLMHYDSVHQPCNSNTISPNKRCDILTAWWLKNKMYDCHILIFSPESDSIQTVIVVVAAAAAFAGPGQAYVEKKPSWT